jgi:hypothetical protein
LQISDAKLKTKGIAKTMFNENDKFQSFVLKNILLKAIAIKRIAEVDFYIG